MNRFALFLLLTASAVAQSTSGTAGQSGTGSKMDDQQDRTAVPKNNRKTTRDSRRNATTVPPTAGTPTMPTDPKTPTDATAPRTPIKPTDPTRPEDPTKPSTPPPIE